MYSMAYDPRIATALAQEHIDRRIGRTTATATARSGRRPRRTGAESPVATRPPHRLVQLARRVTTTGTWLRAHAS